MNGVEELDLRTLEPDSVLASIIVRKIADVSERARHADSSSPDASDRSFIQALANTTTSRPPLIAEIKRRSPSKGPLREDLDLDSVAAIYGRHAAAISVVTDTPFFAGTLEMLTRVRSLVKQPVMLKDFVITDYQVLEARAVGADALLLMASVLMPAAIERLLQLARSLNMEAVVEVHDRGELDVVLEQTSARIVGVNNRDLSTLAIDMDTFPMLADKIRARGLFAVAESGMQDKGDIDALVGKADAVLIGTAFMTAKDIEAKIRELGW
jgi:indole-3-glycerol phosphate synthase